MDITDVNQEDIQVFPNPSSGIFTVSLTKSATNPVALAVYDISGRKVFSSVVSNTKEARVDLSEFKSGTYIFKLIQEERQIQKRIIKLK